MFAFAIFHPIFTMNEVRWFFFVFSQGSPHNRTLFFKIPQQPLKAQQLWSKYPHTSLIKPSYHTILSANKKWLPTRAKKRIQKQAVRIGTEAVLHFPSISPMCMLRGSVMWKKGRGWHIWLIHKFRTEPAFWKWLIQGDWEEMEGNEVGGPWIKGARKGDWYWRAVVHG